MFRLGCIVLYETIMQGGNKRVKPSDSHGFSHHQGALKCPRCDSFNTKFCYYNNYNLSQPRHFCKGCRRYWTNGGVLRNVPVGGGCRKANRCASSCKPKRSRATPPVSDPPPHFPSNDSSGSSRLSSLGSFSLHEAPPLLPGYRSSVDLGFFMNHVNPVPLPPQAMEETRVDGQNWIKNGEVDQGVFDLLPSIDTVDYWGETTITGYQSNVFLP